MSIGQFLFLYIPNECQKPFKLARYIEIMSNLVVLTKERIIERIPSDNIPLSIASPTRDLSSLDYVKELVHTGASYQVIPATHNPFNYNAEDILVGILPKTKNILLDISLPFYNSGNDHQEGYYYGRYLIYNQRLIAVRLSCATRISLSGDKSTFKRWPAKKVSTWKLPPGVLRYYKASNFNERTYKREIKVGDFILEFKNLRISLLFESQLKSVQNLLDQSLRVGSEIISIVNDTPRDKTMQGRLNSRNYSLHSTIQNQLKIFGRKNKKIVMYCGCKLAPLTELYLSNSFIVHHQLPEAKLEPHFLNSGGTLTIVCNVDINQRQLGQSQPTNSKGVHVEKVNERLPSIKSVKPGKDRRLYPFKSKYHGPIPEEMSDILQKMHLWYVFNTINECQPFIIPLPLCQFTHNILKQFQQISTYTLQELKNYLAFYKQEQNLQISKDELQANVDIYDSLEDLMTKLKADKYFVYIDNPKNHKSLYNLAQENPRIIVCPKSLMREEEIEKNKILETIEKRINDFAQKIIDYNIYSFKKILIENQHSPEPLTKDQLIFAINDSLKNKIRTSFRSHPFFRYILSKNRSELEDALGEAQILRRQQCSGITLNQSSKKINNEINSSQQPNSRQEHREPTKDFFSKLDRMKKYFGNDKKVHQMECHRCQKYVFKNYVTDCSSCNKKTCYFCFEAIKSRPSHPQAYKECLVCKKLCFCDDCTEKKKKHAKQKQKIRASTEQIISLSQTQPQKSLEQLQQIRIRKELAEDACQICQIQGREVMHIKVICSQCDHKGCFNCIKSKEKGDRKFIKEWLCERCRPTPLRISEEMNVMTMIDEQVELNTPYESAQNQPQPNLSPISLAREPNKRSQHENVGRKRNKSPSKSKSPLRQKKKPRSPSQSNSPKRNKKNIQPSQPQKRSTKPENTKRPRSPSDSKSPPRKRNESFQQPSAIKQRKPRSPSNSASPPRNLQKQKKKQSLIIEKSSPPKNNKRARSPSHSNSPKRQKKKISPSKSRSRSRSPQKERREDSRQQKHHSTSKPLWGKNASKSFQERSFDKSFDNRGRGRGRGQDRGRGGYNGQRNSENYDRQEEHKSMLGGQEARGGDNLNIQDPNDIDY